jgi:adenosylhomocysteine nucleosidase
VSEIVFDDPCVVFSLRREARAFLRLFPPNQRFAGAPCPARFCGPAWLSVLVLEVGLGQKNAANALEWLLGGPALDGVVYRPKLIINAGFAGGLEDGLEVGDLILASEVADTEGNRWPVTWPKALPPGPWQPPLQRGRLLTTSRIVSDPEEKRALGAAHQALSADMESAAVARVCSQHSVPFGCVRAISDDVNSSLSPQLADLLSGGGVSLWRLGAALVRKPLLIGELRRLARDTRFAAEQLAKALGDLLTLTLPWTN